jgi:hypothetical protein
MKIKKLVSPQKNTLKEKKQKQGVSLLKETSLKPSIKKSNSSDSAEARERAEWKKERRDYWSGRFRRILAEIAVKPKVKKSNFL